MSNYLYILGTIVFTVFGQMILKWRIGTYGELPQDILQKIIFLVKLIFDPLIFSGLLAAFVASLFWMAAMTKFNISYAYPFMSLNFVLVLLLSALLLREPVSLYNVIGLSLIVLGIYVSSMTV